MEAAAPPEAEEPQEEKQIKPFAVWLLEQREGGLALELADQLNGLVEAVHLFDKGGTLTLKITVKPSAQGVTVADVVTVKKPESDKTASFFFVDGDMNLTRADPTQRTFDELRTVDRATGELKEVAR